MVRAVGVDMLDGLVNVGDCLDGEGQGQEFGVEVGLGGVLDIGIGEGSQSGFAGRIAA